MPNPLTPVLDELERLRIAYEAEPPCSHAAESAYYMLQLEAVRAAPALIAAARSAERMRAALKPFANYAHVLELLANEDRSIGSTNGWSNVDPVLGARGQIVTLGDFRRARAALAEPAEKPHGD